MHYEAVGPTVGDVLNHGRDLRCRVVADCFDWRAGDDLCVVLTEHRVSIVRVEDRMIWTSYHLADLFAGLWTKKVLVTEMHAVPREVAVESLARSLPFLPRRGQPALRLLPKVRPHRESAAG